MGQMQSKFAFGGDILGRAVRTPGDTHPGHFEDPRVAIGTWNRDVVSHRQPGGTRQRRTRSEHPRKQPWLLGQGGFSPAGKFGQARIHVGQVRGGIICDAENNVGRLLGQTAESLLAGRERNLYPHFPHRSGHGTGNGDEQVEVVISIQRESQLSGDQHTHIRG